MLEACAYLYVFPLGENSCLQRRKQPYSRKWNLQLTSLAGFKARDEFHCVLRFQIWSFLFLFPNLNFYLLQHDCPAISSTGTGRQEIFNGVTGMQGAWQPSLLKDGGGGEISVRL